MITKTPGGCSHGEKVVVVDNLQSGHQDSIQGAPLYTVDICDEQKLREVFRKHDLEAVMHFSASSLVGESMENPYRYYHKRRPGDPAILTASSEKALSMLGWNPSRSRLEKIIEDAWNWHRKNPTGFGNRNNTAGRDINC